MRPLTCIYQLSNRIDFVESSRVTEGEVKKHADTAAKVLAMLYHISDGIRGIVLALQALSSAIF